MIGTVAIVVVAASVKLPSTLSRMTVCPSATQNASAARIEDMPSVAITASTPSRVMTTAFTAPMAAPAARVAITASTRGTAPTPAVSRADRSRTMSAARDRSKTPDASETVTARVRMPEIAELPE